MCQNYVDDYRPCCMDSLLILNNLSKYEVYILIPKAPLTKIVVFAISVDQDRAAQNTLCWGTVDKR